MFDSLRAQPAIIGLVLVMLLAFLVSPNILPEFLSNSIPGFYEGIPCIWLRNAQDRANHQSLIGRGNPNPLAVSVETSALPTDPAGFLYIRIVIANNSLGTVPFVYDPAQIIVGDNGTSGLGIAFSPQNSLITGAQRQDQNPIPEANIRLLGPRQRCVHTLEFPAGNVMIDPAINSGTAQVVAFYRNNSDSQTIPTSSIATPIFSTHGLWTGLIQSSPVVIPVAAG